MASQKDAPGALCHSNDKIRATPLIAMRYANAGQGRTVGAVQALPSTSQNLWALAAHIILSKALPKLGLITMKWLSAIVKA